MKYRHGGGIEGRGGGSVRSTGAEGLGGLPGRLGGGSLVDDLVAPQPTDPGRGNDVLGEIFGSKDVSRSVAQNAASRSGLDASLLRRMLPMLAMLVAGYLSKQGGSRPRDASPDDGGLLGARGGLASMFDTDGNGNPPDDLLRSMRQ